MIGVIFHTIHVKINFNIIISNKILPKLFENEIILKNKYLNKNRVIGIIIVLSCFSIVKVQNIEIDVHIGIDLNLKKLYENLFLDWGIITTFNYF